MGRFATILLPMWRGKPTKTLSALRAIAAAGEAGVTNADLQAALDGLSSGHVCDILTDLERKLLARRINGQTLPLRFAATQLGLDEIAAHDKPRAAPKLVSVDQPIRSRARQPGRMAECIKRGLSSRPGSDQVAPPAPHVAAPVTVTGSLAPRGNAIVPAKVKPAQGIAAGYDPRYQCAPGERPLGAGFAAAGIGRDITTGRWWGR